MVLRSASGPHPPAGETDALLPDRETDTETEESLPFPAIPLSAEETEPAVSGTGPGASVLWGYHVSGGSDFASGMKYMDIETGEGVRNISAVPYSFAVLPDVSEKLIFLEYRDQFDVSFVLFGSYDLEGSTLKVEETAEDAPLEAVFGEAPIHLKESLELELGFRTGGGSKSGWHYLENTELSAGAVYKSAAEAEEDVLYLEGRLSGKKAYRDIAGIRARFRIANQDSSVQLTFTDGGFTTDAALKMQYNTAQVLQISYSTIRRPYNGRVEDFTERGTLFLYTINCYPYGFILYDDRDDAGYYYYQDYYDAGASERSPGTETELITPGFYSGLNGI